MTKITAHGHTIETDDVFGIAYSAHWAESAINAQIPELSGPEIYRSRWEVAVAMTDAAALLLTDAEAESLGGHQQEMRARARMTAAAVAANPKATGGVRIEGGMAAQLGHSN